MEKEFIPYELALKMKAIGFDEKSFKEYDTTGRLQQVGLLESHGLEYISAPTWQSAFRWFRDALDLDGEATRYNISKSEAKILSIDIKQTKYIYVPVINGKDIPELENMSYFLLKEEAELACLEKLIEIAESKKL